MRATSAVRLASASFLVLGLALGAPAMAQQATGGATTATPGSASGSMPGQSMKQSDIKQKLTQLGIKDQKELKGSLAQASSPEGNPVLLVFGPEDMQAGKSADISQEQIRNKLTQAGFSNVNFVADPHMMRGELQNDTHILAFTGMNGGLRTPGQQARTGTATSGSLEKHLNQVGLKNPDEFKGKLLRSGTGGDTLFVLVGSKDFKGDKAVNLSADTLNRFQQQGFEAVEAPQNIEMVQGMMEKSNVIALAGSGLTAGGSMTTGTGTTLPSTTTRPGAGAIESAPGMNGRTPGTTR